MHTRRVGGMAVNGWFLLAAHGGAGAGLLQQLSEVAPEPGAVPAPAVDAGQLWPDPAREVTGAVVVVTRTTVSGLMRARDLAAQYLAGAAPAGAVLLGVVVIADQPGPPPGPVARSIALLDGVFARTWQVPYVSHYRLLGPQDTPAMHPAIADVLADIRATLTHSPLPEGPSQ